MLQFFLELTGNFPDFIIRKETVVRRCSVKKLFLEISQIHNFIKKEILVQVFSCEFCKISKKTFFHRTPMVAASVGTPI